MRIVPYGGFGTASSLSLMGRVLDDTLPPPDASDASAWRNLLAMFRQIESDELPGICVRAELGAEIWEAVTDDEGYFHFTLRPQPPLDPARQWHKVSLTCDDAAGGRASAAAITHLLTPAPGCRFGIVSDIDDTILWSYATAPLRAAVELLLKNAMTRQAIAGAPDFYRALHDGDGDRNPIFYVSLSPWNLYEMLDGFVRHHEFPEGPLLLRDLGIQSLHTFSERGLKVPLIRHILDTYPDLPFILSGDSGQHDPETYHAIVKEYPGRILAVYLRDVTGDERRAEIEVLAAEMEGLGVPLTFAADTEVFHADALRRGLIRAAAEPQPSSESG